MPIYTIPSLNITSTSSIPLLTHNIIMSVPDNNSIMTDKIVKHLTKDLYVREEN